MFAVIKHVVDDNIICIYATQLMHRCMVRATQLNSCCAKLSTSFLLSYGPNRPELNSVVILKNQIMGNALSSFLLFPPSAFLFPYSLLPSPPFTISPFPSLRSRPQKSSYEV